MDIISQINEAHKALDEAGIPVWDDNGKPISLVHRIEILARWYALAMTIQKEA